MALIRLHHIAAIIIGLASSLLLAAACCAADSTEAVPPAAGIILNKAGQLADKGKIEEALAVLAEFQKKQQGLAPEKAKSRGYSHFYVDVAMGNYCLMLERPEDAAAHYRAAVKKERNQPNVWLNMAKCYYDLGRLKQAGDAFLTAYGIHEPPEAKHLYYSVTCYASAGQYQKAYDVFRKLLADHAAEVTLEWKETLVHVLLALEKPAEALPYIEELAEKSEGKKQRQWREVLLYQYIALKRDAKALSYAKWLTVVDTTEPKWWKSLAHLYFKKDQYREGLVALLAYGFISPLTPEETEMVADIHMMLGIPDQAAKYYQRLLTDSVDPETLKKLVQSYLRLYRPEAALEWIDRGMAGGGKVRRDLLQLKAEVLYQAGRFDEAAALFARVGETAGKEQGRALLMLGYSEWNAGNMQRAKKAFTRAEKHKKQRKEAQKALKSLAAVQTFNGTGEEKSGGNP